MLSTNNRFLHGFAAAILLFSAVVSCGDDKKKSDSTVNSAGQTVFTDSFSDSNNWDFLNNASGTVSNGVLSVTAPSTEGIAIRLKDSVLAAIGNPSSFFIECKFKPTSVLSGSKNIGIASHVNSTGGNFYYAGFNANGRMQAGYYDGTTNGLKGYQNSNDGTTLAAAKDFVTYKWRLEYDAATGYLNFYCNDLYMGKATGGTDIRYLAGLPIMNYAPGKGYSGSVGIYSCGGSFDISEVRVGALPDGKAKLVISTTDSSLPRLWSKYLRLIDNSSSTGMKVGDTNPFVITALKADGSDDGWTASVSDKSVLSLSAVSGVSGDTLNVTGLATGTATVTVSNASDSSSIRTITYTVSKADVYVTDAYSGISTLVYPNIGSSSGYTDGEIAITFDSAPVIADSTGKIYIYNYSTGAIADTIKLSNDTAVISGRGSNAVTFGKNGDQRVRISGNVLYITPHDGALSYSTQYYVAMPSGPITGTLGGVPFTGFSPANKTWNFTTKAAPSISGTTITVDGSQSSTANFRTVQAALSYVNSKNLDNAVIQIQPGTYRELLTFSNTTITSLTLCGMGSSSYGTDVVIQYPNGEKINSGTSYRTLSYFAVGSSATLNLKNLELMNTADKASYGQAETLYFNPASGGYLVANNCTINSHQDTIQTKGSNLFYNCYISGDTDFIWGYASVSLFEGCKIHCLSDSSTIFQARCLNVTDKGYVLLNCDLVTESTGVSYFARSNGPSTPQYYDNASIINCTISGTGTLNSWEDPGVVASTPAPTPSSASAASGWKQYGLTNGGSPVTVSSSYAYTLNATEYSIGWSTRALILGSWSPVLP
jgi:pectin methylesterase-like acyl-CoA thioesterase